MSSKIAGQNMKELIKLKRLTDEFGEDAIRDLLNSKKREAIQSKLSLLINDGMSLPQAIDNITNAIMDGKL
jgi:hypothetical protein